MFLLQDRKSVGFFRWTRENWNSRRLINFVSGRQHKQLCHTMNGMLDSLHNQYTKICIDHTLPWIFVSLMSCTRLTDSLTNNYFPHQNSKISVAFNQFRHRGFPSWIHGRWSSNVGGSTIFLSLCYVRFSFHFFALADLHIGELSALQLQILWGGITVIAPSFN